MIIVSKKWKLQSCGTQSKWHNLVTDLYYKADDKKSYGGCEGLAETICSDLLDKSNIGLHAHYRPVQIQAGLNTFRGCESPNFREDGDRFLTGTNIISRTNFDPERLRKEQPTEQTIREFIQLAKEKTDGYDISTFLCKLLEFDQLVLNTDRNLGNISLLQKPDGRYLPIVFDNGRSFLTNELVQHPNLSMEAISNLAFSVPFSKTHSLQVNAIEQICGVSSLFRTKYTLEDLDVSFGKCSKIYPKDLIERVRSLFLYQMEQHPEYFLTAERERLCKEYIDLVRNQCPGFSVKEETDTSEPLLCKGSELKTEGRTSEPSLCDDEELKTEGRTSGFPLGDLRFTWEKDRRIQYTLSIPTKKFFSLSEGLAFPLTPPEQINGTDREEIQCFLTTIREFLTEEKEKEIELER